MFSMTSSSAARPPVRIRRASARCRRRHADGAASGAATAGQPNSGVSNGASCGERALLGHLHGLGSPAVCEGSGVRRFPRSARAAIDGTVSLRPQGFLGASSCTPTTPTAASAPPAGAGKAGEGRGDDRRRKGDRAAGGAFGRSTLSSRRWAIGERVGLGAPRRRPGSSPSAMSSDPVRGGQCQFRRRRNPCAKVDVSRLPASRPERPDYSADARRWRSRARSPWRGARDGATSKRGRRSPMTAQARERSTMPSAPMQVPGDARRCADRRTLRPSRSRAGARRRRRSRGRWRCFRRARRARRDHLALRCAGRASRRQGMSQKRTPSSGDSSRRRARSAGRGCSKARRPADRSRSRSRAPVSADRERARRRRDERRRRSWRAWAVRTPRSPSPELCARRRGHAQANARLRSRSRAAALVTASRPRRCSRSAARRRSSTVGLEARRRHRGPSRRPGRGLRQQDAGEAVGGQATSELVALRPPAAARTARRAGTCRPSLVPLSASTGTSRREAREASTSRPSRAGRRRVRRRGRRASR